MASSLPLQSTVGFAGGVKGGLHYVDGKLIYPVGATLVVRSLASEQKFLRGHTDDVSAVAVSKSGKFLASGQVATHVQQQAEISVWDTTTLSPEHTLRLHKGGVKALAFSYSERYLLSLGAEEDGQVALWDLHTGSFLASATASRDSAGVTKAIAFSSTQDDVFVTGGDNTLRVWTVDGLDTKLVKIKPAECQFATIKRVINCITIDPDDVSIWCGTTSGDVLQVNLANKIFKANGPDQKKTVLNQGIHSIVQAGENLVVGTGTGTIAVIKKQNISVLRTGQLEGSVTSITVGKGGKTFYCGTEQSNIYTVTYGEEKGSLDAALRSTCHFSKISGVAFAWDYSELFATCSQGGIRVWNAKTSKELLRIDVPGVECLCVAISRDGKSIVSGWKDSKIRAFAPQTGKSLYTIHDAHPGEVTSLGVLSNSGKLITGGSEAFFDDEQLRLWRIGQSQSMELALKEHRSKVSAIAVSEPLIASCSQDGSCVVSFFLLNTQVSPLIRKIWSLGDGTITRVKLILCETVLNGVALHPEGHAVTVGTDKRITWWDARDGMKLRSLEGKTIQNAVAISSNGKFIATAGDDSVVRLWSYEKGDCLAEAGAHSAPVTALAFSPNGQFLVSVGTEAAIMSWQLP